jgi:3-hydroxyisobutyrate dehydrogenase
MTVSTQGAGTKLRVGVAGLGRMGSIFAGRLLAAGYDVGVWNRTRAKADALAETGARAFGTPAQLVEACDAVIVSVADEEALEAVYGEPGGFLSTDLSGRVLLETSTVAPRVIHSLAARVEAKGGELIDAPILGSTVPARDGKVVVLLGGRGETVERIRSVFDPIGRRAVYTGASGSAAAMKLVVNMHLCTYWQSLAESIAMGERNGLTVPTMVDVLLDSPMATPALASKIPVIRGETSDIGFDIAGVCDVIARTLELADLSGVKAPTAESASVAFEAAKADGYGALDVADIIKAAIAASRW